MRNYLIVNNQNNKMLYLHFVYCSSMMRAIFSCLSTTKNFLMQYILTSMTQRGQGCLLLVDLYQLDSGETMQDYGDNMCSGLTCRNSFSLFFCYGTQLHCDVTFLNVQGIRNSCVCSSDCNCGLDSQSNSSFVLMMSVCLCELFNLSLPQNMIYTNFVQIIPMKQ